MTKLTKDNYKSVLGKDTRHSNPVLWAQVDWLEGFSNDPRLKILLLNTNPPLKHQVINDCYFAHSEGLVDYVSYNPLNQQGFGGRTFSFDMEDGSQVNLKGPWSSCSSYMNTLFFPHSIEASLTNDPKVVRQGHTFMAGAVSINKALEALSWISNNMGEYFGLVTFKQYGERHYSIVRITDNAIIPKQESITNIDGIFITDETREILGDGFLKSLQTKEFPSTIHLN